MLVKSVMRTSTSTLFEMMEHYTDHRRTIKILQYKIVKFSHKYDQHFSVSECSNILSNSLTQLKPILPSYRKHPWI